MRKYINRRKCFNSPVMIFVAYCALPSCTDKNKCNSTAERDFGLLAISKNNYTNSIGMEMVCTSQGYWVSTTEVTEGQYGIVLGLNRIPTDPSSYNVMPDDYAREKSKYPIRYIAYDDAVDFCEVLSKSDAAVHNGTRYLYTIPSWSQWRNYVADAVPEDSILHFDRNIAPILKRVASKKPNRLGLYDTIGNIAEYCSDWYDQTRLWRMIAGASYLDADTSYWRKDCRSGLTGGKSAEVGFRVISTTK